LCKRKAVSFGLTVLRPQRIDCGQCSGYTGEKYGGSLFESLLKKGEDEEAANSLKRVNL
jgi:hypothetical protein